MNGTFLDAEGIASYLGIPRSAAYVILHREDCPTVQWGKRLYISKRDLDRWIEAHKRVLYDTDRGGDSYGR